MANFARIDENNIVVDIQRVHDDYQHEGEWFLSQHLGLGGRWIQTSFTGAFRKQYAGIGYRYDEVNDIFIAPQPFPSWTLDSNWDWQPPIPKPNSDTFTFWNEENQIWESIN